MDRRKFLGLAISAGLCASMIGAAWAEESVKVGLILPMTGPFASTGKQVLAGAELYLKENGATIAGKRIELVLKDDGGKPDDTKRLAQELIVNDGVKAIAGFGLTPLAFAAAPVATQGKVPMIVMAAATSVITEKSPYIVRSSFTLPQAAVSIGTWAVKQNIKTVATLVADYAPGIDAEKFFKETFTKGGGKVLEEIRVPVANPDFAPFLQKVRDVKPDAVFVFVPSGVGAALMKQFSERGLDKAGIRLIGTGDVTDDDILDRMGDVAVGFITAHHYSAAHDSAKNKAFVAAFARDNDGARPNFMGVGGYDGMHLLHAALQATKGDTDGEKLVKAMQGMKWESPRGSVMIDPATRDIIQDIYIRNVERVDGHLFNVEVDKFSAVKDPGKQ